MTAPDNTRLLAQLRTLLDLTNTEIQVAETRVVQARTEAVRRELSQNAENARKRADALQSAIRKLGGYPDVIGPFLGRAAAAVKALTEQAQPFDEALLGDLALENQAGPELLLWLIPSTQIRQGPITPEHFAALLLRFRTREQSALWQWPGHVCPRLQALNHAFSQPVAVVAAPRRRVAFLQIRSTPAGPGWLDRPVPLAAGDQRPQRRQ